VPPSLRAWTSPPTAAFPSRPSGEVLEENASRLPPGVRGHIARWGRISGHLRKDRELTFYGREDVTPSSFYTRAAADEARAMAEEILATAEPWIT
jgi:hypothetical protein